MCLMFCTIRVTGIKYQVTPVQDSNNVLYIALCVMDDNMWFYIIFSVVLFQGIINGKKCDSNKYDSYTVAEDTCSIIQVY